MRRWAWIAGLAALLLVAIALGGTLKLGSAQGTTTTTEGDGITVTGNGTVNTVPDRATFTFGVHTESATAAAALGANGALMTKVIDAIEKAGVAKGTSRPARSRSRRSSRPTESGSRAMRPTTASR